MVNDMEITHSQDHGQLKGVTGDRRYVRRRG